MLHFRLEVGQVLRGLGAKLRRNQQKELLIWQTFAKVEATVELRSNADLPIIICYGRDRAFFC